MYCYRRVEGCLYGGKLYGWILGFWVPRECRIIPIACRSPNVVLSQWPVGDSFLVISVGQWGCFVAVSSLMAPDGSSDPWNIFSLSFVHTRTTHNPSVEFEIIWELRLEFFSMIRIQKECPKQTLLSTLLVSRAPLISTKYSC